MRRTRLYKIIGVQNIMLGKQIGGDKLQVFTVGKANNRAIYVFNIKTNIGRVVATYATYCLGFYEQALLRLNRKNGGRTKRIKIDYNHLFVRGIAYVGICHTGGRIGASTQKHQV